MRKNDQKAESPPGDSDSCRIFAAGRRLLYALAAPLRRFAAGMRFGHTDLHGRYTEEDVFIPTQEIYQETYSSDSAEFAQTMDILSRYTYHRSFRTLTGAHQIDGNHAGFWLHVYLDHGNDRVDFACGGTGEILIDSAWRVGYWGDRASLSMMAELTEVFEKQLTEGRTL